VTTAPPPTRRDLFCFIRATAATDWLTGIALDQHGFVLTDSRLRDDALRPEWNDRHRTPLPFETNTPGVFAVGDARAGR
jgi:thioredoxin reductase (NADPH)